MTDNFSTQTALDINNLLTIPAAARVLGKPKMTLYRWINKGHAEAMSLGGILFITTREVERLKEEKRSE